MEYLIF